MPVLLGSAHPAETADAAVAEATEEVVAEADNLGLEKAVSEEAPLEASEADSHAQDVAPEPPPPTPKRCGRPPKTHTQNSDRVAMKTPACLKLNQLQSATHQSAHRRPQKVRQQVRTAPPAMV